MPLPRFARLDPDKREKILSVAAEEFAKRGYEEASLNRIIARCGMSKGAMYYYFSDKDDLYATVLKGFVDNLLAIWSGLGEEPSRPFGKVETPEAYWDTWVVHYRRSLRHNQQDPVYGEMFHRCLWSRLSGTAHPALNAAVEKIREWIHAALQRGEEVGAVRKDLPEGLLLDTVFGMLEGFDRWLLERWKVMSEREIDEVAKLATEFLRRITEPVSTEASERKR